MLELNLNLLVVLDGNEVHHVEQISNVWFDLTIRNSALVEYSFLTEDSLLRLRQLIVQLNNSDNISDINSEIETIN